MGGPVGDGDFSSAGVVRQQFERWFQAMEEGTVFDWAEEVMTPSVEFVFVPVWGTRHITVGPYEFCEHYNRLVNIVWGGPTAQVTWKFNRLESHGPLSATAAFLVGHGDSPMFPGWMRLNGKERNLEFHVELDETHRMKSCCVCIGMPNFDAPTQTPDDHRDFIAMAIQMLCVATTKRGLLGFDAWTRACLATNAVVSVAGAQAMAGSNAFMAGIETLFDELGWSAHEPAPLQSVSACRTLSCGAVMVTVSAITGQTLEYTVRALGGRITSLALVVEALPSRSSDPPSLLSGLDIMDDLPPRAGEIFKYIPVQPLPPHPERARANQVLAELRSAGVAGKLALCLQQLGVLTVVTNEQGEAKEVHDFREGAEALQRSGVLSTRVIWEGWSTGSCYERCCFVEPGPDAGRRYFSIDFVFISDAKLVRIEVSSGSATTDAVSPGAGRQLLRGFHAAMECGNFDDFANAVMASDTVVCMEDYTTRPGDVVGGTTLDMRELLPRYSLHGHPIVHAMRTSVQELSFSTDGSTARTRSRWDVITRLRLNGKSLPTPFPRQVEVHQIDFSFKRQRVQQIHITVSYDPAGPLFQAPPTVQRVGAAILNAALLPPHSAVGRAERFVQYAPDVMLAVTHASEEGKTPQLATTICGVQNLVAHGAGAGSVSAAVRARSHLAWRLEGVCPLSGGRGTEQRAVFSVCASPLQHPWIRWSRHPPGAPPIHLVIFDVRTNLAGAVEVVSVFVTLPSGDWSEPMTLASAFPPYPAHCGSSTPVTWSQTPSRSPRTSTIPGPFVGQLPAGIFSVPAADTPPALLTATTTTENRDNQSLSPSSNCPPCSHNQWDSVRIKRGWVILRCRKCSVQWRVEVSELAATRCVSFDAGACDDSACRRFHIFRRKLKEGERGAPNEEQEI